jgi:hypothetical protein
VNWIINFQIMNDEYLGGGLSTLLGQCKCWGNIPFSFGGHCVLILHVKKNWRVICVYTTWN